MSQKSKILFPTSRLSVHPLCVRRLTPIPAGESLIKVVPYVLGVTLGVPGAPEPRMYPRSGYFLVNTNFSSYSCADNVWQLKMYFLQT